MWDRWGPVSVTGTLHFALGEQRNHWEFWAAEWSDLGFSSVMLAATWRKDYIPQRWKQEDQLCRYYLHRARNSSVLDQDGRRGEQWMDSRCTLSKWTDVTDYLDAGVREWKKARMIPGFLDLNTWWNGEEYRRSRFGEGRACLPQRGPRERVHQSSPRAPRRCKSMANCKMFYWLRWFHSTSRWSRHLFGMVNKGGDVFLITTILPETLSPHLEGLHRPR